MSEHIERRPTWECQECGDPWPCELARKSLAAELGPTRLRIHMWLRIEDAAQDMPRLSVRRAFERFLGWT